MRRAVEAIDAAVRDCINYCGVEADLDDSLEEYRDYLLAGGWSFTDVRPVLDRA